MKNQKPMPANSVNSAVFHFGGLVVVAAAILVAAVMVSGQWASLKKQELNNQASFECAQSSRYSITKTDGTTVWYPVEDLYKKCLSEKEIK